MKTVVNQRLREELTQFRLRFTCADCAYYDETASQCSHRYPSEAHRSAPLPDTPELLFCKEFELV